MGEGIGIMGCFHALGSCLSLLFEIFWSGEITLSTLHEHDKEITLTMIMTQLTTANPQMLKIRL